MQVEEVGGESGKRVSLAGVWWKREREEDRIYRGQVRPARTERASEILIDGTDVEIQWQQQARRLSLPEAQRLSVIAGWRRTTVFPQATRSEIELGNRIKPNNVHRDKDVGRASRSFGDDPGLTIRERLERTGQAKVRPLGSAGLPWKGEDSWSWSCTSSLTPVRVLLDAACPLGRRGR